MSSPDDPVGLRFFVRLTQGAIIARREGDPVPSATEAGVRLAYGLSDAIARHPTEATRRDMGEVLFGVEDVRERVVDLHSSGDFVRLALEVDDSRLADLCWEAALPPQSLIEKDVPNEALGLWERFAVVRVFSESDPTGARNSREPLFRSSLDAALIDARRARPRRALNVRIPSELETPFTFEAVEPVDANVFGTQVARGAGIIHFAGHASGDTLQTEADGAGSTWSRHIKPNLSNSLRLVVLEACATGANPKTGDRISLAYKLAEEIPGVVAMLSSIGEASADIFTEAFYKAIGGEKPLPIDFAVASARWELFQSLRGQAAADDWMLPVLYLSTGGSARVEIQVNPDLSAPPRLEQAHEPLPVIASGESTVAITWDGGAFRTQTLSHQVPAEGAPNVRLAPAGDVGVTADALGLHVWNGSPQSIEVHDFPPQSAESSGNDVVLAAQLLSGGELEVAVARPAGISIWRRRAGSWRQPRPALEGTRIVSGVLLSNGFLGVTGDGRVVSSSAALHVPDAAARLTTVAGVDAISVGGTDLLALWGKGPEDEPGVAVFTRVHARTNDWRPVDINTDLPAGTVRVGFRRENSAGRARPGSDPRPINLVVQAASGELSEHSFSLAVRK